MVCQEPPQSILERKRRLNRHGLVNGLGSIGQIVGVTIPGGRANCWAPVIVLEPDFPLARYRPGSRRPLAPATVESRAGGRK